MADSFASFARKLDKLTDGLRDPQLRKVMERLGDDAQKIAEREASADLGGDPKFSGWKPPLDTQVKHLGEGRIQLRPTRSSAGPWTVATVGRNQGNAGGFAGPGINTRTGLTSRTKSGGLRKMRGRRAKRWNGRTQGKGTADRVQTRIGRDMPDLFEKHVRDAIRKAGLT
jgi:hypothetical protein